MPTPTEPITLQSRLQRWLPYLYCLGRPLSPLYALLMWLRALAYQQQIFKVHSFPIPVISIGNLTLGGSGKTPLVCYLAEHLQQQGKQVAIISRGYGGSSQAAINLVSAGQDCLLTAAEAGDEPCFLAHRLPGVFVLTGKKRYQPAQRAIEMGADILLLDDGFQHLAMARDLNLALFNSHTLLGNGRIFPGGELREPRSALSRADGLIFTQVNANNQKAAQQLAEQLGPASNQCPVFQLAYVPQTLIQLNGEGLWQPVSVDPQTQFFLFSGIGHPAGFQQATQAFGIFPIGHQAFPDHHAYTPAAFQQICKAAQQRGATALLTTEKDLVKLKQITTPLPLYGLRMTVKVLTPDTFHRFLQQSLT